MDDVEHAIRQPRLSGELGEAHGGERHALRRLEDVRISRDHAHREHPQRDHRGKVEGRDASAHAKWQAVGVHVGRARHSGDGLAHLQRGGRASVLDHLEPAEDVALGVVDRLTMLGREQSRQLVLVLADERLQLEHDARTVAHRGGAPRRECRLGRIDRRPHLAGRRDRCRGKQLLGRWVAHRHARRCGDRLHELSADQKRHARRNGCLRGRRCGEEARRPAAEQQPCGAAVHVLRKKHDETGTRVFRFVGRTEKNPSRSSDARSTTDWGAWGDHKSIFC